MAGEPSTPEQEGATGMVPRHPQLKTGARQEFAAHQSCRLGPEADRMLGPEASAPTKPPKTLWGPLLDPRARTTPISRFRFPWGLGSAGKDSNRQSLAPLAHLPHQQAPPVGLTRPHLPMLTLGSPSDNPSAHPVPPEKRREMSQIFTGLIPKDGVRPRGHPLPSSLKSPRTRQSIWTLSPEKVPKHSRRDNRQAEWRADTLTRAGGRG